MKQIKIYTMKFCPFCEMAKRLCTNKGWPFKEILVAEDDEATWKRLEKETGYKTVPQIFFGEKFIGGYSEMSALDSQGKLEELL